jgi:CheY-like chemotaxis protein
VTRTAEAADELAQDSFRFSPEPALAKLVLLVDNNVSSRRDARQLLEARGMDVVQASTGLAALELVQRLPKSFRLVLVDLHLPGIAGGLVVETLRLFRPDLPVLCMSSGVVVAAGDDSKRCLAKPLRDADLGAALEEIADRWAPQGLLEVSDTAVARARSRYAVVGDLVEAALELSDGEAATGGLD